MITGSYITLNGIDILPLPLSDKEIRQNIKLAQNGSKEAGDKVFVHNLRFVTYIVNKFANIDYNHEDLFQIGSIGLIKAINSFDLKKNTTFATYANCCIHNEILMFLRKIKNDKKNISLEQPIFPGEEKTIQDVFCISTFDIIDNYIENEERKIVKESLSILSKRDREIVMLFFGFYNGKCYTQKELAKIYNITQSYVSRLIKKSINKLKEEILIQNNEKVLVR